MEWLGVNITRAAARAVLVDDEGQVRASAPAPGPDRCELSPLGGDGVAICDARLAAIPQA